MPGLNTLFFVETRRIENPRNILQLLSMNTRRTKVVELSSGTHRWAVRAGCWEPCQAGLKAPCHM